MPIQQSLFDLEPDDEGLASAQRGSAVAAAVRCARVIVPEGPATEFDYRIPDALASHVEPGKRLLVPFGRGNRSRLAYCVEVGEWIPTRKLKSVVRVLDDAPLLSASMLALTRWMADYYLCDWGQVLAAVVPASVRAQAGTRKVAYVGLKDTLSAAACDRAAAVSPKRKRAGRAHTGNVRGQSALRLTPQQQAVLDVLRAAGEPLPLAEVLHRAGCTAAPVQSLKKRGLVQVETRRVSVFDLVLPRAAQEVPRVLNADQARGLAAILQAMERGVFAGILLHGVTGSGKTEVYMRAIEEVLRAGRQAIVLVPEISLTPQTCERFRARFPSVAVLHSRLTPQERHWYWRQIARGEVHVVIGARSAVFAPAPRPGLIVLDEEHDASFKQGSTPRYHARDVAAERARIEGIPLVLGSATPSLESWQRSLSGAYARIDLPQRVLDRPLPQVAAIDLQVETLGKHHRGAISRSLKNAMDRALADGGQVILLLNRRGYATLIQCPKCGHRVDCPHCNLALTHHREGEQAICHYCEFKIDAPAACPQCQYTGIAYRGLGTQRLEAEIRARFPGFPCVRMDADSMKKHGSHEQVLARFRSGEFRILLGTQMIAKGLDFPDVTLVGVVNADTALHFPDFRAEERTFQLVTQVAGRAGRGDKGGRVLVQTFSPEHPALQAAFRHDYETFAASALPVRREFRYPPFASLLRAVFRGPQEGAVQTTAEGWVDLLRRCAAASAELVRDLTIRGPAPAPFAKLQDDYRYHALASSGGGDLLRAAAKAATAALKIPEGVLLQLDVDPQEML